MTLLSSTKLLCALCKDYFTSPWDLMVHVQTAHMINIYELGIDATNNNHINNNNNNINNNNNNNTKTICNSISSNIHKTNNSNNNNINNNSNNIVSSEDKANNINNTNHIDDTINKLNGNLDEKLDGIDSANDYLEEHHENASQTFTITSDPVSCICIFHFYRRSV